MLEISMKTNSSYRDQIQYKIFVHVSKERQGQKIVIWAFFLLQYFFLVKNIS